jgi:hypothetical protein
MRCGSGSQVADISDRCVAPQNRLKMLLRQRLEAAGWGEEMQDYLRGTCAWLVVHIWLIYAGR